MLFLVATLTPFDARGRVDLPRLRAHVLWLAAQGVDGFVPTGTAGEFLYLSDREREAIHRTVLDTARGRPVYPCTWDPSPATAAYLTDAAREQGASGALLPTPLLYTLDDDAVRTWYRTFASVDLPVLAHHDAQGLKSPLATSLYRALREEGLVAGMIDASEDPWRLERLGRTDPGAVMAAGDRILSRAPRIAGLGGFVSTLGNVWPQFCLRLFRQGEQQLEDALAERVTRVRRAGGLRAMKSLMRMGCRAPLHEPPDDALLGLPPPEGP